MFSEYFGIKVINFPFNFIIFFIVLFGFKNLCELVKNKVEKYFEKKELLILIYFTIFGIYISLLNILFHFNYVISKYFILFTIFFLTLLILRSIKKIYKYKLKFNYFFTLNRLLIFLIISSYFVISLMPISDSDSLSYHSAIGSYSIKINNSDWIKSAYIINPEVMLSGFSEIINFKGLFLGVENIGSQLNFFSLIFIYLIIKKLFPKKKNIDFIYLGIISSPVILPMVFSQKIFILPSFILALLLYFIYKFKKYNNCELSIIFCSLFIILSFKASFLIIVSFILIYLLYKNINYKNFYIISINLIFWFLIIYSPIIIKNILYYKDILPPFTGSFIGINDEYLNQFNKFLKNYDLSLTLKNLLFLPLAFIIPHYGDAGSFFISLPNIGKIYGIQFYNFLFIKKKIDKFFFFLITISIVSILISGNISTRWFLFLFFFVQLYLIHLDIKVNIIFKFLLICQIVIFALFIIFYSALNIKVLFSLKEKDNFLNLNAVGYSYARNIAELEKKINLINSEYILYFNRSFFWTNPIKNHLNYSYSYSDLINIENKKIFVTQKFKKILSNKKIKILVIQHVDSINDIIYNSFNYSCNIIIGDFKINYATRNFFMRGEKKYIWLHFKDSDFIKCLNKF